MPHDQRDPSVFKAKVWYPPVDKSFQSVSIPILVGTGGSFDNGKDAENFFLNPRANDFLPFKDEATGRETCLFWSGLYRQDCKDDTTLDKYLISEGIIPEGRYPELAKIDIKVSNKEKALKQIEQERESAKKNPDGTYNNEILSEI